MQDITLSLLLPFLKQPDLAILWLIDENISQIPPLPPSQHLYLMTNRHDLHQEATAKNYQCIFSDFDFSCLTTMFDLIIYRVSKERAVVNNILNNSYSNLKQTGKLILCGHNQEGIKTHIKNAEIRFNNKAQTTLEKQYRLATLRKGDITGPLLEDKNYFSLEEFSSPQHFTFFSKPGLFGWNKIDAGSEFLASALPNFFSATELTSGNLLDLGCGYGYLSMVANTLGNFHITATDNNAAAILACQHNFQQHQINGQVIADDCGKNTKDKFDGIVCNPPFHSGFGTSEALTEKFLQQSHRLLKPGKSVFFVFNKFIDIEKKATRLFKSVQSPHDNKQFKLIHLIR